MVYGCKQANCIGVFGWREREEKLGTAVCVCGGCRRTGWLNPLLRRVFSLNGCTSDALRMLWIAPRMLLRCFGSLQILIIPLMPFYPDAT